MMPDFSNPRRVLLMINSLAAGGAERLAVQMANHQVQQGHRVCLVTAFATDKVGGELEAGVERICLQHSGGLPWRAMWRLWRILRQFRPHLYQGALTHGNRYGAVLARLARVPVVTIRLEAVPRDLGWRHAVIDRLCVQFAHRAIACSEAVRAFYCTHWKFPPARVRVIYNPAQDDGLPGRDPVLRAAVRQELGLAAEDFVFLTVARLEPVKGLKDLIDAAAAVPDSPRCRWLIAGDGSLREVLQAHIKATGQADRIRLLGLRQDVPRLLRAADVFVLPSLSEAGPVALLEAMAAQLPVIASEVDALPEFVKPETGWLVPPANVAQLAERMAATAQCPSPTLQTMGVIAREWVKTHHCFNQVMASYETQWREVLDLPMGE